jgi:hypothetical protein
MNRQLFTMNPVFPHPDSDNDQAPTLGQAIQAATEILGKEGASMYSRRRAAFDLMDAFEYHKEQTQ